MEKTTTVGGENIKKISGMYKEWFLDYASYVILERAIPLLLDGLKPVQRRILHSMREMEDGRYNKVANLVGNTMKYHPHGDAAINDALVQIGQKDLLIDTQGNWGNIFTGDRAAAARYIEARLTPFALEVAFNSKTTEWIASYDGRNKEPLYLPMKFPLLLAQGVDGIAVGLSTKILPHNFNELIDASIKCLNGKDFQIYPDFQTGGSVEVISYNDGMRGGKVKVRAKAEIFDKNTLIIRDIPFGTTTSSVMDSIVKASERGKIKIKKIEDNTAQNVEIVVYLANGVSPDKTLDALYAFTDCEVSISPNACTILDEKPHFLSVKDILFKSTTQTKYLLKRELEIELSELKEKLHFSSLEKIFIENKIYRDIEDQDTWEGVINAIKSGLQPYLHNLERELLLEDIERLTEIKIKRISRFDLDKANQTLIDLRDRIQGVNYNLIHLTEYAIEYFKNLKIKYGKGRDRKTEIKIFDQIEATKVAAINTKLFINRIEGFIGTSLKKDEFAFDCSDIDNIICITKAGNLVVTKVDQKTYIEKNILHVGIWKKRDNRTVYNLIYFDGSSGNTYMKRFNVISITRDKMYSVVGDHPKSQIFYFSSNPNGEAEVVEVILRPKNNLRKLKFEVDFSQIEVKSKFAKGNLVTKHSIKKILLKTEGISTLAPRKIWFDEVVNRLNVDAQGEYLGTFSPEDKILCIKSNGEAQIKTFDLGNHFDEDLLIIEKWNQNIPISCIYYDADRNRYYIKRFLLEDNLNVSQQFFIQENPKSHIEFIITQPNAKLYLYYKDGRNNSPMKDEIDLDNFIKVMGIKAKGNQVINREIDSIELFVPDKPLNKTADHNNENQSIQGIIEFED